MILVRALKPWPRPSIPNPGRVELLGMPPAVWASVCPPHPLRAGMSQLVGTLTFTHPSPTHTLHPPPSTFRLPHMTPVYLSGEFLHHPVPPFTRPLSLPASHHFKPPHLVFPLTGCWPLWAWRSACHGSLSDVIPRRLRPSARGHTVFSLFHGRG